MSTALTAHAILERLAARYRGRVVPYRPARGEPVAVVAREHLVPVLAFLREDAEVALDVLVDLAGLDAASLDPSPYGERFAVSYLLRSSRHGHRFDVRCPAPERDPAVPCVTAIWPAAADAERELSELFGLEVEDLAGAPSHRLLLPVRIAAPPLRRDYPLRGLGERDAPVAPGAPPEEEVPP